MSGERESEKLDLVAITVQALESVSFKNSFLNKSAMERSSILAKIKESFIQLKDADYVTLSADRRESRYLRSKYPEELVCNMFRKGRYLDFSAEADTAGVQDGDIGKKVLELVSLYEDHIERFKDESLAHLCLSRKHMDFLSEGKIYVRNSSGEYRPCIINTISELRNLLEENNEFLMPYSRRRSAIIYRTCNKKTISTVRRKLSEWEAIPVEPQAVYVSA